MSAVTPAVDGKVLTIAAARELVRAATAEARELDRPLAVAVCDGGGHLVAFERMDRAPILAIDTAIDKAYTAAAAGLATDAWFERIKDDPPAAMGLPHRPRLVVFGGGLPLLVDGHLVGGIGISGGHHSEDLACARTAVEAVGLG